jgi:hypothetical protein
MAFTHVLRLKLWFIIQEANRKTHKERIMGKVLEPVRKIIES